MGTNGKQSTINAIFSIDEKVFENKSLIFFGSNDNRFITNRAYDLIFFLSKNFLKSFKSFFKFKLSLYEGRT